MQCVREGQWRCFVLSCLVVNVFFRNAQTNESGYLGLYSREKNTLGFFFV